jgi:peptidoglycan/LPS O-acetylase OafA/YrhL
VLLCKCLNFDPPFCAIYINTIASFAFLRLINLAAEGVPGRVGQLLQSPVLCHIGKMSYSIFLLHDFTELLVPRVGFFRLVLESNFKAVLLIPLTILVAHVAWRFVECPVLSLRRKYLPVPALASRSAVDVGA